jgi:hypothetical protein
MSNRDTYNSSVKSATATQAASVSSAELTKQTTIDNSNSVQGYSLQSGNYGALASATKSAAAAKAASLFAAEQAKQIAIGLARDVLRSAGGDLAAF